MSEGTSDQPNAQQRVEVTAADLPLHCPMPDKRLWDSHPRVFLGFVGGSQLGLIFVLVFNQF